jgi:hypothetical protein
MRASVSRGPSIGTAPPPQVAARGARPKGGGVNMVGRLERVRQQLGRAAGARANPVRFYDPAVEPPPSPGAGVVTYLAHRRDSGAASGCDRNAGKPAALLTFVLSLTAPNAH